MEIKLEQRKFPSGTVEVVVQKYVVETLLKWLQYEFTCCKFRSTYTFEISKCRVTNDTIKLSIDQDLVENPKSLTQYDWQLLRILHSEVKSFQWEVFQVMKDLVDNRIEEDYSLQRIKGILQQENKIES